jgi:hypothetical protein
MQTAMILTTSNAAAQRSPVRRGRRCFRPWRGQVYRPVTCAGSSAAGMQTPQASHARAHSDRRRRPRRCSDASRGPSRTKPDFSPGATPLAEEPKVCRLTAGGKWIRTSSSARETRPYSAGHHHARAAAGGARRRIRHRSAFWPSRAAGDVDAASAIGCHSSFDPGQPFFNLVICRARLSLSPD